MKVACIFFQNDNHAMHPCCVTVCIIFEDHADKHALVVIMMNSCLKFICIIEWCRIASNVVYDTILCIYEA